MKLSGREATFLQIGAAVALFLLILSFYLLPTFGKIKSLGRSIAYHREVLEKIIPLSTKLEKLTTLLMTRSASLMSKPLSTDEFRSRISKIAENSGIPANSMEIKFTGTVKKGNFMESSFRVEIKNITYPELLNLIRNIESSRERFIIREGIIKPTFESNDYLNLTLKISVISKEIGR